MSKSPEQRLRDSILQSMGITEDDIKAKFEDGVLKLEIPKKEAKPAVEEKKYISIEG